MGNSLRITRWHATSLRQHITLSFPSLPFPPDMQLDAMCAIYKSGQLYVIVQFVLLLIFLLAIIMVWWLIHLLLLVICHLTFLHSTVVLLHHRLTQNQTEIPEHAWISDSDGWRAGSWTKLQQNVGVGTYSSGFAIVSTNLELCSLVNVRFLLLIHIKAHKLEVGMVCACFVL
jgi:hypothetical protein